MSYDPGQYLVSVKEILKGFFTDKVGAEYAAVFVRRPNTKEMKDLCPLTKPVLAIIKIGPGRNIGGAGLGRVVDNTADGRARIAVFKELQFNLYTILDKQESDVNRERLLDMSSSWLENLELDSSGISASSGGHIRSVKISPGNNESDDEWWIMTNLMTLEVMMYRDVG